MRRRLNWAPVIYHHLLYSNGFVIALFHCDGTCSTSYIWLNIWDTNLSSLLCVCVFFFISSWSLFILSVLFVFHSWFWQSNNTCFFSSINKHHYFSPIKQSNRIESNRTELNSITSIHSTASYHRILLFSSVVYFFVFV